MGQWKFRWIAVLKRKLWPYTVSSCVFLQSPSFSGQSQETARIHRGKLVVGYTSSRIHRSKLVVGYTGVS